MATLFYGPRYTPVDAQGDPYPGATLTFYAAGTTTPQAVYTTAALTTPHSNPVVAAANGSFDPIYLNDALQYRVILRDGSNTLLFDVDNVNGSLTAAEIGLALYPRSAAEISANITPTSYRYPYGNLLRYGANSSGTADASPALVAAWAQFKAGGARAYAPAGTYRMDTEVDWFNGNAGVFVPGPVLVGEGVGVTIFDNRVSSGYMLDIDSDTGNNHATFKGLLGGLLYGFTIKTNAAPASSSGIRLRTAYNFNVEQVHITGMSGNGIVVPCQVGDNDGSNMLKLKHVRIENCAGWGIKADGDSGFNETSFIEMEHVFIQACGTNNAAATPPSGGMIWKGQILALHQSCFTLNENCALFIPGAAGLGQTVDLQNTTFENNKKRGLYCTGIAAFKGRNIQFYNNNTYTATNACEFDGASFTVRNVDINGVVVRATSGNNAYTAFKISGTNAELQQCRVRNVAWDNFDYTGQTRFDGWLFDHVPQECQLVVDSTTSLLFRAKQSYATGRVSPLRLRGGLGGAPSTTGEWTAFAPSTSGIVATNSGLSNATRYYVYLYDNVNVPALEISTSTPVLDTASGYMVKTGDATRLYVGSVLTDGSAQFTTSGTGWLNPEIVWAGASALGSPYFRWRDSTGDVRVSSTAPTSDTDGTIVGTQS